MKGLSDARVIHSADRTYWNALSLLNGRRRDQRPSLHKATWDGHTPLNAMPALEGQPTLRGRPGLTGMKEWLNQLGHADSALDGLNAIHVAGTKGKGSTCAFVNSFLHVHKERTGYPMRIGMYTSPHMKTIRERIRINSMPISQDLFTRYFFEVWDALSLSTCRHESEFSEMPRYLQLLALLSVHIFIKERVDAAIYETHHGGEYDATNIFSKPAVTGITTIGMDHVEQLGPSIQNISWHKAGIMKSGTPAFSSSQNPDVATVLQQRAVDRGVKLSFVEVDPRLPLDAPNLKPEAQKVNCSLGLSLAISFLQTCAPRDSQDLDDQDINQGVERFSWLGRYHHIIQGTHHWFLDGAHNMLSIGKAGSWFAEELAELPRQHQVCILIFSHTSERDGVALLKCLAMSIQERGIDIKHAIFTTYEERQDNKSLRYPDRALSNKAQQDYAQAFRDINSATAITIQPTVEQALVQAEEIGNRSGGMQTLITGSLYLVGGALRLLEPETQASLI